MRIVSWNCNMGFEKKRDVLMSLKPDIAVLQECSAKDIYGGPPCQDTKTGSNKSYFPPFRLLFYAQWTSLMLGEKYTSAGVW